MFTGNCTVTVVVSASSRSFGTRTTTVANAPGSHSPGLSVTWATAAGTAMAIKAMKSSLRSTCLTPLDGHGDGFGQEVELAHQSLDAEPSQSPAIESEAPSITKDLGSAGSGSAVKSSGPDF